MTDAQFAGGPIIYGIPLALWVAIGAVVFAPIISLAGVVLSNRNARKNLKIQLGHDADERSGERKMALRREVYLEAAAALAHSNGLIGRITNIENDQKMLGDEFAADLAKIAKVQIVGSDKTVQAIMNYVNALGPAFIELVAMRVPLMVRKAAIELEDTFVDAALAERKRFTAMMQQLNLDQVTDAAKWDPIRKQSEIAADAHRSHAASRSKMWGEQLAGIFDIVHRSLELTEKLIRLLPPAILAVRSEMELPLDAEWYTGLWSEQLANMKAVTGKMLASLQKSIDSQSDDAAAAKLGPPAPPSRPGG